MNMVALGKVLIVEDDLIVQLHLKVIVGELGYDVTGVAATADEALDSVAQRTPNIVLMDIRLAGDGHDGIELAGRLREQHDLAVVFVTAYADEDTVERAERVGVDGYVIKPFSKPQLRAALSTAASNRRRTPPAELEPASPVRSDPSELVPFGANTRMAIFSHDTFGLGHLRRSLNISRALTDRYPGLSILLLTGSPVSHRFAFPPGVDTIKLPSVRKAAEERYQARALGITDESVLQIRTNVTLYSLQDYRPHVLLVDHAPLGMKGELRPSLEWLHQNLPDCRKVLGLRDVLDAPDRVRRLWAEQRVPELLDQMYDHILVYGSARFFDPREAYDFPPEIRAKTTFCNFVVEPETAAEPSAEISAWSEEEDSRLIVLTIGGGDGGEVLIDTYLEMLQDNPLPERLRTLVFTGPFLPKEHVQRYRELSGDLNVEVVEFVPSTSPYLQQADLVLCTCGYNTMIQTLRFAKRAVVVPRQMHREEQVIRARQLGEMGLVYDIHPTELTVSSLRQAISYALTDPEEPITRARNEQRLKFDGTEQIADFFGGLRVAAV